MTFELWHETFILNCILDLLHFLGILMPSSCRYRIFKHVEAFSGLFQCHSYQIFCFDYLIILREEINRKRNCCMETKKERKKLLIVNCPIENQKDINLRWRKKCENMRSFKCWDATLSSDSFLKFTSPRTMCFPCGLAPPRPVWSHS